MPDRIRELEAERDTLKAKAAMLTDTVVMAAKLWFGEYTNESERDYASECLHETASDLVRNNPRLAGAYKGADHG